MDASTGNSVPSARRATITPADPEPGGERRGGRQPGWRPDTTCATLPGRTEQLAQPGDVPGAVAESIDELAFGVGRRDVEGFVRMPVGRTTRSSRSRTTRGSRTVCTMLSKYACASRRIAPACLMAVTSRNLENDAADRFVTVRYGSTRIGCHTPSGLRISRDREMSDCNTSRASSMRDGPSSFEAISERGRHALEQGQGPAGRRQIHVVRRQPHAIGRLDDGHPGVLLKEIRQQAHVPRRLVGYHDECGAAVRGRRCEELAKGRQTAGRGPDPDDGEAPLGRAETRPSRRGGQSASVPPANALRPACAWHALILPAARFPDKSHRAATAVPSSGPESERSTARRAVSPRRCSAGPRRRPAAKRRSSAASVSGAGRQVGRVDVLVEPAHLSGAGDRHDERAPAEHPGQGELRRAAALGGGQLLQAGDQRQVVADVLGLETRHAAPEVGGAEASGIGDGAGQEAAAERAVGDEADVELGAQVEQRVLRVPRPQGVLGLQRRQRMDGVCAADGGGDRLADSESADLALGDQPGHGAHGVLDRHRRVDSMDVVEVDDVHPEAAQARLARLRHVLGPAIGRRRPARRPDVAELGGQHDLARRSLMAWATSSSWRPYQ